MANLVDAIDVYEKKLEAIENARILTDESVVRVLLARDQVHVALNDDVTDKVSRLMMVNELDGRLKKLTSKILAQSPLQTLRNTRSAPANAWWWALDQQPDLSRSARFFNAATILLALFILGLVLDIAPRFIGGGSDTWGTIVVALQGFTVIFAVGTLFSSKGDGAIDVLLVQVGISTPQLPQARLIMATLITLALFGLRAALPAWSQWDNNQGDEALRQGELQIAEAYFERALRLNANNYQTHYNLGSLYETLGDFARARSEYTLAATSGLDSAYNNLGRLLILQGDQATAVQVVKEGLTRAQDPALMYYLHKNLGWARLKQGRYDDALQALQAAIVDAKNFSYDGAAAHCLLAQTLEAQGKGSEALAEWYQCKAATKLLDSSPEMDEWGNLAEQRLRQ